MLKVKEYHDHKKHIQITVYMRGVYDELQEYHALGNSCGTNFLWMQAV